MIHGLLFDAQDMQGSGFLEILTQVSIRQKVVVVVEESQQLRQSTSLILLKSKVFFYATTLLKPLQIIGVNNFIKKSLA